MRVLAVLILAGLSATSQTPDAAKIDRHGDFSTLSVHTIRPLDAVAKALKSQFGLSVGAEDPFYRFKGDMMDISREDPRLRTGTMVPARWGFDVRFAVNPDGSPRDIHGFLMSIVVAANVQSQFGYRLDEDSNSFSFVPTLTHDVQGGSIPVTPLLDLPVTIPSGTRKIHEIASLMAEDLSAQTGLKVYCCESMLGGYPWGMKEIAFAADHEPARIVLHRLGLKYWHMRCDETSCIINMR